MISCWGGHFTLNLCVYTSSNYFCTNVKDVLFDNLKTFVAKMPYLVWLLKEALKLTTRTTYVLTLNSWVSAITIAKKLKLIQLNFTFLYVLTFFFTWNDLRLCKKDFSCPELDFKWLFCPNSVNSRKKITLTKFSSCWAQNLKSSDLRYAKVRATTQECNTCKG